MTPTVLLATLAGLLIAGGLVMGVAGWQGAGQNPGPRPARRPRPRLQRQHVIAVAAGLLTLLVTGWPVAGLAAAGAVIYVPLCLGGAAAAKRAVTLAVSLAGWTRRLKELLGTDGIGTITEALRYSVVNCPPALAPQVSAMVARLGPQGVETAMRLFAHDVNDTAADKIAMVIILRDRNGGGGLIKALEDLEEELDARAASIREVEAERAKPRSQARTVVIAFLVFVGVAALVGRSYLSSYNSPLGEVALAIVVAMFGIALRWLRKLSEPPPAIRVLADLPREQRVLR